LFLVEPHAGLISIREFDAGRFEGATDGREIICAGRAAPFLKVDHDPAGNIRGSGKGVLVHFNQTPAGATLRGGYRQIVQRLTSC